MTPHRNQIYPYHVQTNCRDRTDFFYDAAGIYRGGFPN